MVGSIVEQHPFVGRKHATKQNIPDTTPKTNMESKKMVVCRCVSFSKGVFSGSMIIFLGEYSW